MTIIYVNTTLSCKLCVVCEKNPRGTIGLVTICRNYRHRLMWAKKSCGNSAGTRCVWCGYNKFCSVLFYHYVHVGCNFSIIDTWRVFNNIKNLFLNFCSSFWQRSCGCVLTFCERLWYRVDASEPRKCLFGKRFSYKLLVSREFPYPKPHIGYSKLQL